MNAVKPPKARPTTAAETHSAAPRSVPRPQPRPTPQDAVDSGRRADVSVAKPAAPAALTTPEQVDVPYGPPYVQRAEVKTFINQMAAKHGLDAAELTAAFAAVPQRIKPKPVKPGQASGEDLPFYRYMRLFDTPENVQRGVDFAHTHAAAFAEAKRQYGVDAEAILGILSVESKFGTITSRGPVLSALVQRAFDGGRTDYFRSELDAFLGLCQARGWAVTAPQGSSAGAMGYMQFMPSNIAKLMVSATPGKVPDPYDADDAILSIANYLENAWPSRAWRTGEASAVKLSGKAKARGRLYTVQGEDGKERWDLRANHSTFLAYNQSDLYALTVGIMGRKIDGLANAPSD